MDNHDEDRLKFGNDALDQDDILARAIGELRDAEPARDLWPGVVARIQSPARPNTIAVTWSQLAVAASLLMAVSAGLTWFVARQPVATPGSTEAVVQAQDEPVGSATGQNEQANFADKQYDAAVTDLEKILRDDRDRLDPGTVMVIERNLRTIDDAIAQAREALDKDPANPYLNSHLADSRRRKLELLRRATTLASTSGD
jgi:hypothetical protein